MHTDSLPQYSVPELNQAIGNLLSRGFAPRFYLHATVSKSQLKNGHLWLTLSDGKSTIGAVIWASILSKFNFLPNEQDGVEILGKLNFWESRASLIVQVIDIRPTISTVLKKFEVVKELLIKEGLIDQARMRLLPKYPSNIAVLTSVPSSALADILRTSKERWPLTKIFIFSIPVQGDVSKKIQASLDNLVENYNQMKIEAIVLARGGGSREDLMIFDDAELCRKLACLPVPLITGLGHEDDLTVADLVADHRSATPTAAIVDLLPSREIAKENFLQIQKRLKDYFVWAIDREKKRLSEVRLEWDRDKVFIAINRFRDLLDKRSQLLQALSPDSILNRGFSIVSDCFGNPVKSLADVKVNQEINIELADGDIKSKVQQVKSKRNI